MMNDLPEDSWFGLRDIRKSYGDRVVLDGVTCDIPAGKTTVVLGESGAGKSILLKHLNGLIRPDSGSVRVGETQIAGLSEAALMPIRRKIGILFQDGALFDSLTVAENVAFPLIESGERDRVVIQDRVNEVLGLVDLAGEGEKLPGVLSGGMKKRVALARALITKPACLLCDEPTAGLDPLLAETISRLIRGLTLDNSITSVVVTHDLAAMRIMADHVIFLKDGRVRFSGTTRELYRADDPAIVTFLSVSGGSG